MTTNYTSEFPLMLAGTDVLKNPSIEDWNNGTPLNWTKSGSVVPEYDNVMPCGFVSAKLASGGAISQTLAFSDFGVTALPSWAVGMCLAVVCKGSNGTIAVGASSVSMVNGADWKINYLEVAAPGAIVITGGSGTTYVDSIMFGFVVDIDVFMTAFDPVAKVKQETRETPFNIMTQLENDAWDMKATFIHFGQAMKDVLMGAITYLQKGHYYAFILDRKNSSTRKDEVYPYLGYNSQDSPTYVAGAPEVYQLKLNGRGNLP